MSKSPAEQVWERACKDSNRAKQDELRRPSGNARQLLVLKTPITTKAANPITPSDTIPWED